MEDGRLVVSDFGLATNPAQTATVTLMVGTPSYMAPEMSMGDPASFRSDVWAIGVVMHEILFASPPRVGSDAARAHLPFAGRPGCAGDGARAGAAVRRLRGGDAFGAAGRRRRGRAEIRAGGAGCDARPDRSACRASRRWGVVAGLAALALARRVARKRWPWRRHRRRSPFAAPAASATLQLAGTANRRQRLAARRDDSRDASIASRCCPAGAACASSSANRSARSTSTSRPARRSPRRYAPETYRLRMPGAVVRRARAAVRKHRRRRRPPDPLLPLARRRGRARADQGDESGVDSRHRGLRVRSRPDPRRRVLDSGHELERRTRRLQRPTPAGGKGGLGARKLAGVAIHRRSRREPVRDPLAAGSRDPRDVFARSDPRATYASTSAPTISRCRSMDRTGTRCSPRSTGVRPWRAITLRSPIGISAGDRRRARHHVPALAPLARRRLGVRRAGRAAAPPDCRR